MDPKCDSVAHFWRVIKQPGAVNVTQRATGPFLISVAQSRALSETGAFAVLVGALGCSVIQNLVHITKTAYTGTVLSTSILVIML